jgi:hypothetical protein
VYRGGCLHGGDLARGRSRREEEVTLGLFGCNPEGKGPNNLSVGAARNARVPCRQLVKTFNQFCLKMAPKLHAVKGVIHAELRFSIIMASYLCDAISFERNG